MDEAAQSAVSSSGSRTRRGFQESLPTGQDALILVCQPPLAHWNASLRAGRCSSHAAHHLHQSLFCKPVSIHFFSWFPSFFYVCVIFQHELKMCTEKLYRNLQHGNPGSGRTFNRIAENKKQARKLTFETLRELESQWPAVTACTAVLSSKPSTS